MVENARFFTQKRTFLHIFAGGRDDFLAGPKSGFFGSGRGARARRAGEKLFRNFSPFDASPIESSVLLRAANIKFIL
jgi:hypothetical protein